MLIQLLILLGEHGVKGLRPFAPRQKLLDAPDAADAHILGNLYRIGAPGRDHRCSWADMLALYPPTFDGGRSAKQPSEFGLVFGADQSMGLDGKEVRRLRGSRFWFLLAVSSILGG